MKQRMLGMSHLSVTAVAALVLCSSASAGLSDWDKTVESFMGADNSLAFLTGYAIGTDEDAVLSFNDQFDPVNHTFNWATSPGQIFLGQSLTFTGSGMLDLTTQIATVTGDLNWGGTSYQLIGTEDWSVDAPEDPDVKFVLYGPDGAEYTGKGTFTTHTAPGSGEYTTSEWSGTLKSNKGTAPTETSGTDKWDSKNHVWIYVAPAPANNPAVAAQGTINDDFSGDHTITIVPEPTTVTMLAIGVAVLLDMRRRKGVGSYN